MLDVGRWMFDVRLLFILNGFMTTTLIPDSPVAMKQKGRTHGPPFESLF